MLGKFSRGMTVKIPAKFQDSSKKAVDVDNVVIGIEYFDKSENKVVHLVSETAMNKVADGDYLYEYLIPPNLDPGNYIVRIKAKQSGSKSNIIEATDFFEISQSIKLDPKSIIQQPRQEPETEEAPDPRLPDPVALQRAAGLNPGNGQRIIEDVVFDAYGEALAGVLIDVYDKKTYVPRSPSNMKIAAAVTGTDGKWSVRLNPGEYAFVFKGPRTRGAVEFRKVQ
jgi:hypothetical protein